MKFYQMSLTYILVKKKVDYNKKFFRDGSLKPEKNLLFSIKFIPFAEFRQEADLEN